MKAIGRLLCVSTASLLFLSFILIPTILLAQEGRSHGDLLIDRYFSNEVAKIESSWRDFPQTQLEWESARPELQRQLKEMLGLWPEPPRSDLEARITSRHERDGVIVENVVFQSIPGLYVTGNLYRPAEASGKLPAVLYVCGHATVKENGVAYGSKVRYRHHPVWFAKHGYISLILDTLQLGEIEGLHHGTYREGKWWWINRGYTPAGVETWNAIRAVDYLQSRPDVDSTKVAMTGRSGGGVTTWWAGALDERIEVAVPVAGITDLYSYVVDGVVEGHCDCMFHINKFRWSFSTLASLLAPRPLLLANSDKDTLFPLDGVLRVHHNLKNTYKLYQADDHFGLTITVGPHQDTQQLRVPAFHWIDRWLKGEEQLIKEPAEPLFTPQELKVLDTIPEDQLNTRISEVFVPQYSPSAPPSNSEQWVRQRVAWKEELLEGPFAGWPDHSSPLHTRKLDSYENAGDILELYEFSSQEHSPLNFWVVRAQGSAQHQDLKFIPFSESEFVALGLPFPNLKDRQASRKGFEAALDRCDEARLCILFTPRGIGPTAWDPSRTTHIRRRFALLGQTLDAMQVWDIRRALHAARQIPGLSDAPIELEAKNEMALLGVYAALWEPAVSSLSLDSPPSSHHEGPILPFIAKIIDAPQAIAMLLPERRVVLRTETPGKWSWLVELADVVDASLELSSP